MLIIDSKVSLTAYERMTQADDPTVIEQERTAHAASVSAHIKGRQKKHAELYGKSTDYTLMFMPVEASWVALTAPCGCGKSSAKTSCSFQPAP